MARVRKVKQAKVRRIDEEKFKLIKSENKGGGSEEDEAVSDERFSEGESFTDGDSSRRTAPVLTAESSGLEQATADAPAARRNENETAAAGGNLYSANYSSQYSNTSYENVRESAEEQRRVRPAANLNDGLSFGVPVRRTQSAWQTQESQTQDSQNRQWTDSGLSEERRYQPAEDQKREETRMQDMKRRRMMG